jgi:hypothetical protein
MMAQIVPPGIEAVEIERGSYIDWPGVFVGVIVASALSWLLLTFGSAIGFASVSPYTATAKTGAALTLAAAAWFALTQIYSIAMGGYIAARLRPRHSVVESDEVAFRDGVTGLTVWGLAIVIGLVLAGMVAYGAARTGAQLAGAAVGAAASQGDDAAYTVDRLLRPNAPGQAPAGQAQAPAGQAADDNATRQQVGRILANALTKGEMPQADKDYLGQVIAARTGVSPEDAQRRLTEIYDQAKAAALEAADKARKATALAGFWTVFIMFAAGLTAWWAGTVGGAHRDDGF